MNNENLYKMRLLKNKVKRQKQANDQEILNQMLKELREKNDLEKKALIGQLQKQLEKLTR
jgi:anaerobic ribonucleoside-triphosphate reductase